jgi:NADPH:quinone reductase-like Zn-dependent oxidoreductase
LQQVADLMAKGQLRPIVDTVFPLAQARAAQERMLNRDLFGKLVLVP